MTETETVAIPLTNGGVAIIDESNLELVSKYSWQKRKAPRAIGFQEQWYAVTHSGLREGRKKTWMHRLILGLNDEEDAERFVDHRNHDGLDNRRDNLRIATRSQNKQNSRKHGGCTSKYKGVTWYSPDSRWMACVYVRPLNAIRSKAWNLGYFEIEEEAAFAVASATELLADREFRYTVPIPNDKRPGEDRCRQITDAVRRKVDALSRGRKGGVRARSQYSGVFWSTVRNQWHASLKTPRKMIALGRFPTEHEAAFAWNTLLDSLDDRKRPRNVIPDSEVPSPERIAEIRDLVRRKLST